MNICDIHKRSFCFVLLSFVSKNLTINSFNFYGSTISPSWEYLDSNYSKVGPHNYIKWYTCNKLTYVCIINGFSHMMKGNTPETSVLKVTFLTLYEYCYIQYQSYINLGACSSWYDVISASPKKLEHGTAWSTSLPVKRYNTEQLGQFIKSGFMLCYNFLVVLSVDLWEA